MIATPPPRFRSSHAEIGQNGKTVTRAPTLIAAFRFAFAGVGYLLWTQRNARIHCAIGLGAVILGLLLRITRGEWLALVLSIALVLATEGVNTAIEATVDLISPYYHPLAKIAKDVAAGTVLLVSIASVIIGLIIFLPYMLPPVLGWLGL